MLSWALVIAWPLAMLMLAVALRQMANARTIRRRIAGSGYTMEVRVADEKRRRPGLRERWTTGPAAAALRLRVSEYILFRLGSFVVPFIAGYVVRGIVGGILLGFVGLAGMTVYFRTKQQRWLKEAETTLPEFLRGVSSALRAGSSLTQAMGLVAQDTLGPLGEEVRRVLRRETLGFSIAETLAELGRRIPSQDLGLAILAITIQREVGGSLADVLDNITQTIVDRQRLKSEVRILTAQGRYSGWLLTVLPFALGLLMWFSDPSYMGVLLKTHAGWGMVGAAVVMVTIGGFLINRMVRAPEM
jgi:tight adherence protein B